MQCTVLWELNYANWQNVPMPAKNARQERDSPENQVMPYESLNELQEKITGESLPNLMFEICDSCYWCATCINRRGRSPFCPLCGRQPSKIPMLVDETCTFERDEKRGVTLRFGRRLPLR
jgi:hypothetical protein